MNKQRAVINEYKPTSWNLMVAFSESAMILSFLCAIFYDGELFNAYHNWTQNYDSLIYVL